MKSFFTRITVGTSPIVVFSCPVKDFQSVELYAVGALEIGSSGVSVGTGIPMAAGESRSLSHLDFRKDDKRIQGDMIEISAVAGAGTTIQVSGWRA